MSSPSSAESKFFESLRTLWKDLGRLLALKHDLATQEIQHDVDSVRRLLILGGVGIVSALAGLPLMLTALALLMDGVLGFSAAHWAIVFSIPLLLCGAGLAKISWDRFRREFLGLRESIHELREDLNWLRDWLD